MVNLRDYCKFIGLVLILSSCKDEPIEDFSGFPMKSDYFSSEVDTFKFQVFGKDLFSPTDTSIWLKTLDNPRSSNSRLIEYTIFGRNGVEDIRKYIIEPDKLRSSGDSGKDILSIYKTPLLDDSIQKFYYERSGIFTRFFSSRTVDVQTDYFAGKCIWTYLESVQKINDSLSRATTVDEYYGPRVGLVKITRQDRYYLYGNLKSDSIIYKYRIL